MAEYLNGVGPVLASAGGEVVKRVKLSSVISGSPDYAMVFLMDFPSVEAATAVFESDAYAALVPARDEGFTRIDISLAQA